MQLVEPEAVGPIEGDEPRPTAPRPPHRRVSISLVFTLSVLTGLVVAIYTFLPARHDVLVEEAIRHHKESDVVWDLEAPTAGELHAWAVGLIGKDVLLPTAASHIIGARRVEILRRVAAVIRLQIGSDQVTYLVQHSRGIAPEHVERSDGDLRALSWRRDKYTFVAVGPAASAAAWSAALPK
jgi:hypothetical protein